MLPAGPLRENLNEVKNYDLIFLNGEKKNNKPLSKLRSINKNLKIFQGKYKPLNLKNFDLKKKYLMFCGIGNPHEFGQTLIKYKFNICDKVAQLIVFISGDTSEIIFCASSKRCPIRLVTTVSCQGVVCPVTVKQNKRTNKLTTLCV